MRNFSFSIFLFLVACSVIEGPEEVINPFDPQNPDYVLPSATIIQPAWGGVVNPGQVRVSWQGSAVSMIVRNTMEFSHQLDDQPWSAWGPYQWMIYRNLEGGPHIFRLYSRYPTGVTSTTPDSVMFYVQTP